MRISDWSSDVCSSDLTPAAGIHSAALYGRPDDPLPGNGPTAREAARHFIDIADELDRELLSPSEQVTISATALQLQLQSELDRYFGERVVAVELDPDMIAKAAAGARRIRLRTSAQYTDYDHHQLLQHEAFVHSLTALNGREQAVRSEEHKSELQSLFVPRRSAALLLSTSQQVTISGTARQLRLQCERGRYVGERGGAVELAPDMIAKAAAGARRSRLRTSAQYTDYDHRQLLQHEAFVHSLTARNGREQAV